MSNQEIGAGHPLITRVAVEQLFKQLPSETHLGLNEQQFYDLLNKGQAAVDGVPFGGNPHVQDALFHITGGEMVAAGNGTTTLPSFVVPGHQAEHAIGNPYKSGHESVVDIRNHIINELMAARQCHALGNVEGEFKHLGKVAHCVEDSYSQAHMLRDPSNPLIPEARIDGVTNFSWGMHGLLPFNTHIGEFDEVPRVAGTHELARPTEIAGSIALTNIMVGYIRSDDALSPGALHQYFSDTITPYFDDGGTAAKFMHHSDEFDRQIALHRDNEQSIAQQSVYIDPSQDRSVDQPEIASYQPDDSGTPTLTTGLGASSEAPPVLASLPDDNATSATASFGQELGSYHVTIDPSSAAAATPQPIICVGPDDSGSAFTNISIDPSASVNQDPSIAASQVDHALDASPIPGNIQSLPTHHAGATPPADVTSPTTCDAGGFSVSPHAAGSGVLAPHPGDASALSFQLDPSTPGSGVLLPPPEHYPGHPPGHFQDATDIAPQASFQVNPSGHDALQSMPHDPTDASLVTPHQPPQPPHHDAPAPHDLSDVASTIIHHP